VYTNEQVKDFVVRNRPLMLPISGTAMSWFYAQVALQVGESSYFIYQLSIACYVVGVGMLVVESATLTWKQLPKYFLQCIYTLTEPVVFMFAFLCGLDLLGVVQTLAFRDMASLSGVFCLQMLRDAWLQIGLGFYIGMTIKRRRPRQ